MEVALSFRSVLGRRQSICCTHRKLLLFSHAAHVCRVGGLYLAEPRAGGFVAMSTWTFRLPALASRMELNSMHGDGVNMTLGEARDECRRVLQERQ